MAENNCNPKDRWWKRLNKRAITVSIILGIIVTSFAFAGRIIASTKEAGRRHISREVEVILKEKGISKEIVDIKTELILISARQGAQRDVLEKNNKLIEKLLDAILNRPN